MTRTPSPKVTARPKTTAVETWLFDEPDLDNEGLALLAAYRAAIEASRPSMTPLSAPDPGEAESAAPDVISEAIGAPVPRPSGILRLRSVEGVREDRFAGLHGQLLAAGYLAADVLGRSDGLTYRITREGLQRLSNASRTEAA